MSNEIEKRRQEIKEQGDIPEHIAIIMDGNGRWARQRNRPRVFGHREGINSVRDITRECGKLGVKVLTLYTFSVENWSRPGKEVTALMNLLVATVNREVKELNKNNVQLSLIGQIEDLPEEPRQALLNGVEKTSNNTGLKLNLALSYGGRQEIIHGVRKLAQRVEEGEISSQEIDEEMLSKALYTAALPDPDLLIRTSGEFRISNFLLWQIAYSEIYITQTFWPDFREMELLEAINDYQRRERRFGKTSEQVN
ncbi:MAG TPA: isoprenyl transferase [bacterium]|nr:isoprenyl transferase [bacterium]